MITASAVRSALRRKARRAEIRRQVRAAVAAVAHEERAEGEPDEVLYVGRAHWWPGQRSKRTPEERIRQACDGRPCPCADCEEARGLDPMEERVPHWLPLSPAKAEQVRIHEAETARELALWHALVWGPEAAAELARLRPDDRPELRPWAQLRAALEERGVFLGSGLRSADPASWLEVCLHAPQGPPELAAVRGSQPRIIAHCMGAPVT